MSGKLFDDLKQSIEDMGAHLREENVPGITLRTMEIRMVDHIEGPEIKEVRHRLGVSQATLAAIIGVSKKTVEAMGSWLGTFETCPAHHSVVNNTT